MNCPHFLLYCDRSAETERRNMKSQIMNQIKKIRGETKPDVVSTAQNRYEITVREEDAMAVYLFSSPVRRERNGELVDFRWRKKGGDRIVTGSTPDSVIRVTPISVILEKPRQKFTLLFDSDTPFTWAERDGTLYCPVMQIRPTTNGVMVTADIAAGESKAMRLVSETFSEEVCRNSQYLAFMERHFKPKMTVASLFFKGEDGNCHPLKLLSEKLDDYTYRLEWKPEVIEKGQLAFEFNLYEDKLFQDTTVTDYLALENNAFGSIAFLGHTPEYGEQRLYSKWMLNYMSDLLFRDIRSVRLFIPRIFGNPEVEAYQMEERFCSFGSTWENKVPYGAKKISMTKTDEYLVLDLSSYVGRKGWMRYTYGMLLKVGESFRGYGAIATGDSCAFPVFLEIKYER